MKALYAFSHLPGSTTNEVCVHLGIGKGNQVMINQEMGDDGRYTPPTFEIETPSPFSESECLQMFREILLLNDVFQDMNKRTGKAWKEPASLYPGKR